jgi:DNA-binding transcriptional LysR family regulator
MKLQQLRYLTAVVDAGLNISAAAARMHTSQPGVSRQLKVLEDELGFELFIREGRALVRLTAAGQRVVERARRMLREAQAIRGMSLDARDEQRGALSIATTHTQARYVLPRPLAALKQRFPQVSLHVAPGGDAETVARHEKGEADIAIVSSSGAPPHADLALPIYRWERTVLVPRGHALTRLGRALTLADLAAHPLISYESSRAPDSSLRRAFSEAGLSPEIGVTARDADLIKTYVRTGLGVGILAEMAIDASDSDLVALSARGLFPTCTTWLLIRKDRVLRDYSEALIRTLVPAIDLRDLRRALSDGAPLRIEAQAWSEREDLLKPAPVGELRA